MMQYYHIIYWLTGDLVTKLYDLLYVLQANMTQEESNEVQSKKAAKKLAAKAEKAAKVNISKCLGIEEIGN